MAKQAKQSVQKPKPYIHIMLVIIVILEAYSVWQMKNIINMIPLLSQAYPVCN